MGLDQWVERLERNYYSITNPQDISILLDFMREYPEPHKMDGHYPINDMYQLSKIAFNISKDRTDPGIGSLNLKAYGNETVILSNEQQLWVVELINHTMRKLKERKENWRPNDLNRFLHLNLRNTYMLNSLAHNTQNEKEISVGFNKEAYRNISIVCEYGSKSQNGFIYMLIKGRTAEIISSKLSSLDERESYDWLRRSIIDRTDAITKYKDYIPKFDDETLQRYKGVFYNLALSTERMSEYSFLSIFDKKIILEESINYDMKIRGIMQRERPVDAMLCNKHAGRKALKLFELTQDQQYRNLAKANFQAFINIYEDARNAHDKDQPHPIDFPRELRQHRKTYSKLKFLMKEL